MTLPAPAHVHQIDGSAWGPSGCMGAAAAMCMDAYTRGAIRPGMNAIRNAQDDKDGGIGLDDVATAWKRGWGLTFVHGHPSWATIAKRLDQGDGLVITVLYAAMGAQRAPGSTFGGAHALYLQGRRRTTAGSVSGAGQSVIVTNDPLRRGPVELPEAVLQRAYTGGAGWGGGVYGAANTGATGAGLGAFYKDGRPVIVYPRGSTSWTADGIIRALAAVDYFAGPNPIAEGAAEDIARGIFRADEGRPWNEALHAEWSRELKGAAVNAGTVADPLAALGQLAPTLAELPARTAVVGGIVVLALVGVVLTFREPLTVALPAGRALRGIARG